MGSAGMSDEALRALTPCAEVVREIEERAETMTTPCGEGRMRWRLWGEGPPLILLHGDFGSWTHWLRNIEPLSSKFQVIAPDLPGYGDSAMPPEPWSPESLARILSEGLCAIVPSSRAYDLAGFSFGGIVAGHLAARDGKRVRNFVLLGAGGFGSGPAGRLPTLRRLAPEMDAAEVIAVHRHNLAALMLANPERVDDLAVYLQIGNLRQARTRAGGFPTSDSLLQALPSVRARIHGIWGESDVMAAPHIEERKATLGRFQPDLDFRIVTSVGHWTSYEASETVNAALMEMFGHQTGSGV